MDVNSGYYIFFLVIVLIGAGIVAIAAAFRFFKPKNLLGGVEKSLELKNYHQAIDLALKYLKDRPPNFLVYKYMGEAYEGLAQYRHSIENYEKSLVELKKDSNIYIKTGVMLKLGELYRQIGKKDEALGYYKMVLSDNPKSSIALWNVSAILYENERYNQCRDYLIRFNLIKPNDYKALLRLSKVYYFIGDYQNSINLIQKITSAGQYNSITQINETMILLAYNYFNLKRYTETINVLKPFLKERIVSGDVFNKIIISMIKLNQGDRAVDMIDDNLLRLAPNERCKILYEIGNVFYAERDIINALTIWDAAYQINPRYLDLGNIMKKYDLLYKNEYLKAYFINDDEMFKNYVLKKLNVLSEKSIIETNEDYMIIHENNSCSVLYRQANRINEERFKELEDTLENLGFRHLSINIYSLFGIDDNAKKSLFYNKIKDISENEFLKIFNNSSGKRT